MRTLDGVVRKILVVGALAAVTLGTLTSVSGCAADTEYESNKVRLSDFISAEFEPFRAGLGSPKSDIHIGNIPEYARTVPTHPDDPSVSIPPLENKQLDLHYGSSVFDYPAGKLWLLDIIGAGIGYRPDFAKLGGAEGDSYNYAVHYAPGWGPAYTMYQVSAESKNHSFRYFFEAKTPNLQLGPINDSTILGLGLFGGYEPGIGEIRMGAVDGWHRWGSIEAKDSYDLGEIEFDRMYVGIGINFIDEDTKRSRGGFRVYYIQDLIDTKITDVGRDFGVKVDNPKPVIAASLFLLF